MKFKKQVYLLYAISLLIAVLLYLGFEGTNDMVCNNQNGLYAVNLFVVVVPAVSLFFSYSWDSLAINKKRLAQRKGEAREKLRRQHYNKDFILCLFSLDLYSLLCFS